jgi:hypothetical protein
MNSLIKFLSHKNRSMFCIYNNTHVLVVQYGLRVEIKESLKKKELQCVCSRLFQVKEAVAVYSGNHRTRIVHIHSLGGKCRVF